MRKQVIRSTRKTAAKKKPRYDRFSVGAEDLVLRRSPKKA
jgi:hypothetical protein